MNNNELITNASMLMAGDKGLLAMDESIDTLHKRFAKLGIPQTIENRRAWRELIVTTTGIGDYLNGAILFDETTHQSTVRGVPFIKALENAGVMPGIKVDEGTEELAGFIGEKITLGLDRLRGRLKEYADMGIKFAKWRAVIRIGKAIPSDGAVNANVQALARYAALCQEAGIVPIVEPEVVADGDHSIIEDLDATVRTIKKLFWALDDQRVILEGLVLKPNMVLPGLSSSQIIDVDTAARTTVECLLATVPATVQGIAFLSGGQSPLEATAHLNAMHRDYKTLPWTLTFSYSRAIQDPAMTFWLGKEENVEGAQQLLLRRMMLNTIALRGEYMHEMESAVVDNDR